MINGRCLGNFYWDRKPLRGAGKLHCADLFAGAGGLSLAAINVGFNVRAAIEWDVNAGKTYRENLVRGGMPRLYNADIRDINEFQVDSEAFGERRSCDIILGGPPCQGFSVHRFKDAGVRDPRNELIHRYFDFVKALRPRVFLMENVPGMLWPRHREYLKAFHKQAKKAGYLVFDPIVVDARNYGVPQRRKRVFILGCQKDESLSIDWPPPRSHDVPEKLNGSGALRPWRSAAYVFDETFPDNDENAIHMNHGPELIEVFKATPLNGGTRHASGRVLPCHDGHNGHHDVYGRIDPREPGPTMTTACINPSKGRFVHPTEHHGITVRQAARFQTFPDGFVFKGGLISAGEQVGNAVPIILGEALLREIAIALLRNP